MVLYGQKSFRVCGLNLEHDVVLKRLHRGFSLAFMSGRHAVFKIICAMPQSNCLDPYIGI